jgi:hypothetical protein
MYLLCYLNTLQPSSTPFNPLQPPSTLIGHPAFAAFFAITSEPKEGFDRLNLLPAPRTAHGAPRTMTKLHKQLIRDLF